MAISIEVLELNSYLVVHFSLKQSAKLPSRGFLMLECTIEQISFITPLEPDGMGSHFFILEKKVRDTLNILNHDIISLTYQLLADWSEPELADDFSDALILNDLESEWKNITTKAKWAWVRWLRASRNVETQKKRIATACSMLSSGKKRPCCFDHSRCTLTQVSKNGKLISIEDNKKIR